MNNVKHGKSTDYGQPETPTPRVARLPSSADVLRRISGQLAAMADTLQHEDQDAKKMADPAAILRQAALDLMASYVAVGVPDSQAAIRACNETGYRNSLELGRQWKDWEPLYAARVLFAKRLLVSILQSRGWSNQAIADVLDVHAKHIPRMKRRLRADVARRKALLQGQEEARQGGS